MHKQVLHDFPLGQTWRNPETNPRGERRERRIVFRADPLEAIAQHNPIDRPPRARNFCFRASQTISL
ncbi:MAG: hypothetical protein WDN76_06595 [Alphaproteobacteria bacterium]